MRGFQPGIKDCRGQKNANLRSPCDLHPAGQLADDEDDGQEKQKIAKGRKVHYSTPSFGDLGFSERAAFASCAKCKRIKRRERKAFREDFAAGIAMFWRSLILIPALADEPGIGVGGRRPQ